MIVVLFILLASVIVSIVAIALVRSFRPIPIDEFDRMAIPLIM